MLRCSAQPWTKGPDGYGTRSHMGICIEMAGDCLATPMAIYPGGVVRSQLMQALAGRNFKDARGKTPHGAVLLSK
jgi:hypothetical protein